MWRAADEGDGVRSTPDEPATTPGQDTCAANEEVAAVVGGIVSAIAERVTDGGSSRSVASASPAASRNPRRRILEDNDDEDVALPAVENNTGGTAPMFSACVIDGDPNLMTIGAELCTDLNSDEEPDVREEPEENEEDDDAFDDGGEMWEDDLSIGELTDEDSDAEQEELPASVWSSIAKDSAAIKQMKTSGWEYDSGKFGLDPTYFELYDGPFGPSQSVLSVSEDPLALLFYFMPPKLWRQIAIESNCYHAQPILQRARAIRAQQRRSKAKVETLADIQRRLEDVPDKLKRGRCFGSWAC